MSYVCDNCGKIGVYGKTGRHKRGVAGKRWKKRAQKTPRMFMPNLQKISFIEKGKKVAMRLCTNCIKRFKKDGRIKVYGSANAALG